jgi:PST family polysaccharide transporter
MSMLALKIDNFIIGRFFGQISLGYYSRAYSAIDLASALLGGVFRTVILTGISKNKRLNRPNVQESHNQFFVAHVSAILCIWPIAITSIIAAPEIIKILLGEQWAQAAPLFQLLAIGMFLRMGYKVSSAFNISYGLAQQEVYRVFIFLIVMSVTTYIGAQFSLLSVTFAVLFSLFVNFILLTLVTTSHLKIDNLLFAKNIMKPVIAMFVSSIITSALCYQLRSLFYLDIYLVITVVIVQLILVSLYIKIVGKHDKSTRFINDKLTSYMKNIM